VKSHNDWVTCIASATTREPNLFVSGDFSGEVKFFRNNSNFKTVRVPDAKITCIVLSPDNSEVVIGTMDGRIVIHNVATGDKRFEKSLFSFISF